MKELKLDVVRFENEDVIATSLCAHADPDVEHILVTAVNTTVGGEETYYVADYYSGPGVFELGRQKSVDLELTSTGWYYNNDGEWVACGDNDTTLENPNNTMHPHTQGN